MNIMTRTYKLRDLRKRYSQATKKEKTKLLDEFCRNFGYNRKHAVTILSSKEPDISKSTSYKKRGPKPKYKPDEIVPVLKEIWFASDQACSKKLESLIPYWLPHYESLYGPLEPDLRSKVLSIKSATIDRILKATKTRTPGKGKCGTKPGSILKQQIPIHDNYWNENEPGFLEADTVAHCGTSLAGDFVWSLTMTDIFSGWTELRATWNKGSTGVIEQIKNIEEKLPFKIKGFDCDNGTEFLNWYLIRYFTDRTDEDKVKFTRSRPYRKNDNAHVEQKNWSCVRQVLGYDRIENKEAVDLINDIYINEWSLLINYFIPTMKLEKKSRIGAKIKKTYSKPITPYERLLNCPQISDDMKAELTARYNLLNPFELKQSMENKLKQLFELIKITDNVRHRI
jgi:hypothetical protein